MDKNIPLKYKTDKDQLVFICLKLLDFEIRQQYEITETNGYIKINDYLFKMFQYLEQKNYEQLASYCKECMSLVKLIDGNHYRIWLFYKIQQIIQSKNNKN
jgi:hypothetical protein